MNKPTRGKGLLENYLAKKRASKANSLIASSLRNGKILDIGCGSFPYFLSNCIFKEKYGIDPSVSIGSQGKIQLKKSKVDLKKLPYENNFFNVVTMLAVFEHIEEEKIKNVLFEIRRILKKDGSLIITTPSPWADKLLHVMGIIGLISKEEIEEHKHNHKKEDVVKMLVKAGFKKNNIDKGTFEMGANMWFTAKK